jgi:hypothetical protein
MAGRVRTGERLGQTSKTCASTARLGQATKEERKRIKDLERELARKDRALAETAALLVLRKKASAIWGGFDPA